MKTIEGVMTLSIDTNFKKSENYYEHARHELLDMVPKGYKTVLDVGCASGGNARYLKDSGCDFLAGVEINEIAANKAREVFDCVINDSIESVALPFDDGYFDLIICGDVLEHLVNPWQVLSKLRRVLNDNGYLICSIPNIRQWDILYDLIFKADFRYAEAGILDQTHLRFFTRNSIERMFVGTGFLPVKWGHNQLRSSEKKIAKCSFGRLKDFLIVQHYILLRKCKELGSEK